MDIVPCCSREIHQVQLVGGGLPVMLRSVGETFMSVHGWKLALFGAGRERRTTSFFVNFSGARELPEDLVGKLILSPL